MKTIFILLLLFGFFTQLSSQTLISYNFVANKEAKAVKSIGDYSQASLTAYIKKNSEKEAQRIAALGAGRVERIGDQLKIKLQNRTLTLKNELGEDIAEGLSNSTLHEFIAFFKEDNVIMVLTTTTGENVKDGFLAEYIFYDGATGNRLISQQDIPPVVSPDGKTFISMQMDDKGAVVTILNKNNERWQYQTLNFSFTKEFSFNGVSWRNNSSFVLLNNDKAVKLVRSVGPRWHLYNN